MQVGQPLVINNPNHMYVPDVAELMNPELSFTINQ